MKNSTAPAIAIKTTAPIAIHIIGSSPLPLDPPLPEVPPPESPLVPPPESPPPVPPELAEHL